MKLFRRKKNDSERKEVNGGRQLVAGIIPVRPYTDYHPVDYYIPDNYIDFTKHIDRHLEELGPGGLDEATGDVLDSIIDEAASLAIAELERQKAEHKTVIHSIEARIIADPEQFLLNKAAMEEDLIKVEEQYHEVYTRWQNYKWGEKRK